MDRTGRLLMRKKAVSKKDVLVNPRVAWMHSRVKRAMLRSKYVRFLGAKYPGSGQDKGALSLQLGCSHVGLLLLLLLLLLLVLLE